MDYSNYNRNSDEIWCSWPIILLALYMFFPLGIYLIIKKQTLHRRNIFTMGQKTLSSAISLIICGGILYLPKIIYSFINNTDDLKIIVESYFYKKVITFGNLFIILGIIVLIIAIYQKSKGKRYRKYISLVVNKEIEDLNIISTKMQLSHSVVLKDLTVMIDRGYLKNYDIDEDSNRIFNVDEEKRKKEEKIRNIRVVQCPNCHANNKLTEKIGKCEFCNSYIE